MPTEMGQRVCRAPACIVERMQYPEARDSRKAQSVACGKLRTLGQAKPLNVPTWTMPQFVFRAIRLQPLADL